MLRTLFRRPVPDCKGRPLAVGDRITGWYDDMPYTGTVAVIGRRPAGATRKVRDITVRRDDGTDHQTFSHAVIAHHATRTAPPMKPASPGPRPSALSAELLADLRRHGFRP